MVVFSKWFTSWKIILQLMAGNVVISEADALTCVMQSKAEKHVAFGGTNWYHRRYNVTYEMLHKLGSL